MINWYENTEQLTKQLVNIKSVTEAEGEEQRIAEFIAGWYRALPYFKEEGLVKLFETQADTVKRSSVLAMVQGTKNGGSNKATFSLYSFKAWKNGEISIDLVPAYKTATGEAGLIDLVTGEFRVSATTTAFAKQPYAPGTELIRQGDKLVMELPVSDVGRTVSLYAGEAYGGTNGWGAAVETVQVAAGETTVEFDLPANWGSSVWFARAKIGEGDAAVWSKTLIAADLNL